MATHTSASTRVLAPDVTETPHIPTTRTATILNALQRRAQAVLNDTSIDAQTRAVIRYGLETNDPWLAKLVRRVDASEKNAGTRGFSQTTQAYDDGPSDTGTGGNGPLRDGTRSHGAGDDGASEGGTGGEGPRGQIIESQAAKTEALAEIICRAGDEAAGALFVLMGILERASHPEVLAHTAKHLAFTRCGEFNLFGLVDAHSAVIERELFADVILADH